MGFGDDSLLFALRVTHDQAEQDLRSAFGVLSKQAASFTVNVGAGQGSGQAAQTVNAVTSAKQAQLELDRAQKDILANERLLLEEILRLEAVGLDTSKARAVLEDKANLVLAQQQKQLGEVVAMRKVELQLTTELARERLIALRNEAGSADVRRAQTQALTLGELANEQERLMLVMKKAESALEKEIAVAKKHGIDVSEAQAVLDQKRSLIAGALVKDAQAEAVARQIALQSQQAQLSVLNKQYALAHAESRRNARDTMGKSFGGLRGVMPIRDFEDLTKSFTTAEALKARTLSLFAGQIGTLGAYAAGFAVVQAAYGVTITRNVELQQELARLSVVVDGETGAQVRALNELRDAAIDWSNVHGKKIKEIVASYYDLGAAGLDAVEILKGGYASLLLSEGGFLQVGSAVELLQSQYQTFAREGNSFIEFANITQVTAAESATMVEELGVAYKYTAASAQTANTSFRELNALLGTLANLGLRGSIGGTSLNQVFTQLTKKRAQIEELGISVIDATGNMRPFIEILADFKRVFGATLSGGEQEILKDLFDVRGARAMERLIQDTTELPRLLGEVKSSSTAAFLAAEKGANTATEAVKVLGNQIANLALIDKAPDVLREFFDGLTNRLAERAALNIESSTEGAQFELEKLQATMRSSADNADYWALKLARAGGKVDGELGLALRRLRDDNDESMLRSIAAVLLLGDSYDILISKTNDLSGYTAEIERLLTATVQLGQASDDLRKGGNIVKELFGVEALTPVSAALAEKLRTMTKEQIAEFAEGQADAAAAALDSMFSSIIDESDIGNLGTALALWRQIATEMRNSDDVSVMQERKRQNELLAKDKLSLIESELRLLEGATSAELEDRKRAILVRRDLELSYLDERYRSEREAIEKELLEKQGVDEEILARRGVLEQKYQNERLAIVRSANARIQEEDLRNLEELYGARRRLQEQERRLQLESADAGVVSGIEREFAANQFLLKGNQLVAELEAGSITFAKFADELALAEGEYDLAIGRIVKAERAREAALLELGGNVALAEARLLVGRVDAWTAFENERTEIAANYQLQRQLLDLEYADDEATLILKQRELYLQTQAELTASHESEAEKRKQATLDSFAVIGDSFGQLSQLMSSLSQDTTASMLGDISRVIDATGQGINILDRMKAGTLGQAAGVLGLLGLAGGVLGAFLSRRRSEEEQVRLLADEFRSVEGSTPTADFGKATTYNVQQNNSVTFRSLGRPTLAEAAAVAEWLGPELLDELRGLGAKV